MWSCTYILLHNILYIQTYTFILYDTWYQLLSSLVSSLLCHMANIGHITYILDMLSISHNIGLSVCVYCQHTVHDMHTVHTSNISYSNPFYISDMANILNITYILCIQQISYNIVHFVSVILPTYAT